MKDWEREEETVLRIIICLFLSSDKKNRIYIYLKDRSMTDKLTYILQTNVSCKNTFYDLFPLIFIY